MKSGERGHRETQRDRMRKRERYQRQKHVRESERQRHTDRQKDRDSQHREKEKHRTEGKVLTAPFANLQSQLIAAVICRLGQRMVVVRHEVMRELLGKGRRKGDREE